MAQKLGTIDQKKLGKDAEIVDKKMTPPARCQHTFEYVTATDIMCKKCHAGYKIGPGDYVRDGHLYHEDELVI